MGSSREKKPSTTWVQRKFWPLALLLRPRVRWLVLPLAAVLLLALGLRWAWHVWGRHAAAGADYVLTASNIEVTPQPPWIHSDVKSEVVRGGGLEGMSLRDPDLVRQVHRAFAMHGWVERVKRVQKSYPSRVTVELEYRRPVAMVEVHWRGKPSLFFLDAHSVLLPKEDHGRSPEELAEEDRHYLRIQAGDVSPAGRMPGTVWDNPRIAGAAKLAALGGEQLLKLGVYRVVAIEDLNAQPLYELETRNSGRIVWGRAPGMEAAGEPAAETKLARLASLAARPGGLEGLAAARRIDLRRLSDPSGPRTAAGEAPPSR
jgi:hypothetical protein